MGLKNSRHSASKRNGLAGLCVAIGQVSSSKAFRLARPGNPRGSAVLRENRSILLAEELRKISLFRNASQP
jgi:hypothetical protein